MANIRLVEIDMLRIVSILIVVIMIHVPLNYAYNFYNDLDRFGVFVVNNVGIFTAMGSFVFASGFGLYLNPNNRKINSTKKILAFLKKRVLRIFPLYWIALVLFLFFLDYLRINPFYLLAHIFGLQIFVAPEFGAPILTLWFIGVIVLYYLTYIIINTVGSIKRIIPVSIAIFFFFVLLNGVFGLVEYRFFFYYFMFIAGIAAAGFFTSPYYNNIKERLIKIPTAASLAIPLCLAVLFYFLLGFLNQFCYSTLNLRYGTSHIEFILERNPNFIELASVFLLFDLIMISFVIFALSSFNFASRALELKFSKTRIESIISAIAYSTFCVYLFHRIFLIIFDFVLTDVLDVNIFARDNFYLVLIFVPFIFLFSYLIQKGMDKTINLASKRKFREATIPPPEITAE
ncbi:MAG: acyltransferase family protein [Candidatus Odinarchaeota archaeon]